LNLGAEGLGLGDFREEREEDTDADQPYGDHLVSGLRAVKGTDSVLGSHRFRVVEEKEMEQ
jgi:hypothetical protein